MGKSGLRIVIQSGAGRRIGSIPRVHTESPIPGMERFRGGFPRCSAAFGGGGEVIRALRAVAQDRQGCLGIYVSTEEPGRVAMNDIVFFERSA